MNGKLKIKSISWKTYVIPMVIITLLFLVVGYFLTYLINVFFYNHMVEDSRRLADNHMARLTGSVNANDAIDEILSEKIELALNVIVNNREKINNKFLEEMAIELMVDKIYWYNSTGKIIYTANDFQDWQATEISPIYKFVIGEEKILIEDIRLDPAAGVYIKYGQLKCDDGEFVQVGILADVIHEITKDISPEKLMETLSKEKEIIHVHFLNIDKEVLYCNDISKIEHYVLDEQEIAAIQDDMPYYAKKRHEGIDTYEALMPIYIEKEKIGTLAIFYSLEGTNKLIVKTSLAILGLLLLVFAVYGIMTILLIKKNRKIEKLAYYDPITGLLNKTYFIEYFKEELKNNESGKRALLLINCNNISLIRLISGYEILDNLLIKSGNGLRGVGVNDNNLFRYSDTKFLIYKNKYKDKQELIDMSKKILQLFDDIAKDEGISKIVSSNIGIVEIGIKDENVYDIIKKAEITIEKIKDLEGQRYVFFNRSMEEELILNEMIKEELEKAIDRENTEEFYMLYQPQLDLKTNRIAGLEALIRWNHKERGFISPMKFISIAERYQLIIPLGEWIMRTVCKFLKELENRGINIKIAINISVIQLLREEFIGDLIDTIDEIGVNPRNLELEITETILMSNYEVVNEKLKILKDLGISISLDDFGTGYSSLNRLRSLNIDILKIDKSFIDNISESSQDDIFVKSIITLANQLNLKVVAEGVETEEQRIFLKEGNCHIMQGYLFSKPIPTDEVIKLLEGVKGIG